MKTSLDRSYEKIHKNGVKKRRMFSLMTALSLIVTSGVVWGLRDTGVTMVNENGLLCSYDEHTHTDECYKLICDMEESEEHSHSADCYELVCTLQEHIHQALCYTGAEDTTEENTQDEDIPIVDLYDVVDDEEEEVAYDELPELVTSDDIELLAGPPATNFHRFNNYQDGIEFNFFDYGIDVLDTKDNIWSKTTYKGINGGSWIRGSGNYNNKDLLFFAYGEANNTDDTQPGINNYSGHINFKNQAYNPNLPTNHYEEYISGNRPVTGIVDNLLAGGPEGFPKLNADKYSDVELDYLFDPDYEFKAGEENARRDFKDVRYLMSKDQETGTYKYISDDWYAYLDQETKHFEVYDSNITIDRNASNNHNMYERHVGGHIGFFPLDEYDTNKRDISNDAHDEGRDGYNHHFGMTMQAKFQMKQNDEEEYKYRGQDIEFSYSGDDDMWVFIDGVLILDLGGIHEPVAGQINFTDGYVLVQDNAYGKYISDNAGEQSLRLAVPADFTETESLKQFSANDSDDIPENLISQILTGEVLLRCMRRDDNKGFARMDYYDLADLYERNSGGTKWDKDAEHTLKVFYLERGGSYSNLAMEFTLPLVKPLTVEKEVVDETGTYKNDNYEFTYQLLYKAEGSTDYIPYPNGADYDKYRGKVKLNEEKLTTGADGKFTLKHGERVEFKGLQDDFDYKIVELQVDPNIFEKVEIITAKENTVQPESTSLLSGLTKTDVESEPQNLLDNNYVKFINYVRVEKKNLPVEKRWNGQYQNQWNGKSDIHFKILVSEDGGDYVDYIYKDPETGIKQRIFALGNGNNWQKVLTGLYRKVGSHTYKYRIEEVDTPNGFVAEYIPEYDPPDDPTGDIIKWTINNKNNTDVQIHVRKTWEHIDPELAKKLTVTALVKRKYVELSPAQRINLTVEVVDQNNSSITSKEIPVYVGGDAEFSLDVPQGAVFKTAAYDKCVKAYESGSEFFFSVTNIEEGAKVTITLDTSNAPSSSSQSAIHHSFDSGVEGWLPNPDTGNDKASVESVVDSTAVSGHALRIFNRQSGRDWDGAKIPLSSLGLKAGDKFSLSVSVKQISGSAINIKLQFDNTNSGGGVEDYLPINGGGGQAVQSGVWTPITNENVTVPNNATHICVQTNGNAGRDADLYIDEFDISFKPNIWDFESNELNGWSRFGAQNVGRYTQGGYNSNSSLQVSGRTANWNGAQLDVSNLGLTPGKQYVFSVYVWHGDSDARTFKVSIPDVSDPIIDYTSVPSEKWTKLTNTIEIPNSFNSLYVEMTDSTADFYIDDFMIEPYVESSNSQYDIVPNYDSITQPMIEGEEVVDSTWSKEIELKFIGENAENNWYYYLNNTDLTGDPGYNSQYSYTYFIDEVSVVGTDEAAGLTMADFEVSYPNNGNESKSNTENDAIVICNKYKWYTLPETGGAGTKSLQAVGLLMITSGIMSCYAYKRRKRRAG